MTRFTKVQGVVYAPAKPPFTPSLEIKYFYTASLPEGGGAGCAE